MRLWKDKSLRRTLIVLSGLLLAAGAMWIAILQQQDRPNIVFLFIDTLRADRMSLYGYPRRTTPNIDAFAATAATFERAYSPSSWTRASFASYFTGLFPSAHGCEGRDGWLDSVHQTLAERLQERGYHTVAFISNGNIGADFGFAQGFDVYEHPPANAGYPGDYTYVDAEGMNQRLLRWLRQERPGEPWFLFVLYLDPHDPYLPHQEYCFGEPPRPDVDGSREFLEKFKMLKKFDRVQEIHRYISGELLDALDQENLSEESVMVLSSDHGEGLWDHQLFRGHGLQVYEEQIHVPLIVRWPKRTRPGSRVQRPVNVMDVFGAMVQEFDLARPNELQAGSIFAALEGAGQARPILSEEKLDMVDLSALIIWPWKLIRLNTTGAVLLYDLATDPSEQNPLQRAHQEQGIQLLRRLDTLTAGNRLIRDSLTFEDTLGVVSEQTAQGLRALGYID
jgi:arylsulfatase A-like enzyme